MTNQKINPYITIIFSLFVFIFTNMSFAQTPVNSQESSTNEIEETKFIRIKKDNKNRPVSLQLANARYVPIDGIPNDLSVDLISAVHIADQSYYENLNTLFKKYDVVLFESVSKKIKDNTRLNKKYKSKKKSKRSLISKLQIAIGESLDLDFQMDIIDYSAKNFVHADLSPKEFFQSMEENGESFASWTVNAMLISYQQHMSNPGKSYSMNIDFMMAMMSENSEIGLKKFAANLLVDDENGLKMFEGNNGSTIITARNNRVLKVLREQIEKGHKKFAIFYGAGHMQEMEKTLMMEFKLKPDQVNWIDAWNLTK